MSGEKPKRPSWSAGFGRCRLLELASPRVSGLGVVCPTNGVVGGGSGVPWRREGRWYRVSFLRDTFAFDLPNSSIVLGVSFVRLSSAEVKCLLLEYPSPHTPTLHIISTSSCVSTAKELAVTTGE